MLRVSNTVLALLNFATLLLSIPIIMCGYWLSEKGQSDCDKFMDKPLLIIGIFLLIVSFVGMVGSCCKVSCLMWTYLFVMLVLIIVLTCFTIFAFVVTHKGAGEVLSGRGFREYRLTDYNTWLQKRVTNNWQSIGSCLVGAKICERLIEERNQQSSHDFNKEELSAVESGCCKPSIDCNFQYLSATNWTRTRASSLKNPDCLSWSNEPNILCYGCQSCKAGLIDDIKNDWKRVSLFNVLFLFFLSVVYSVGCCAFSNIREEQAWRRMERIPLYRGV